MYGYIEGFTDTDDINYCPSCGQAIKWEREVEE